MNRSSRIERHTLWRAVRHDTRGVAMVEFGLMLPLLLTLFYGVVEITRFILITQKVEKLAHSVADVTSQSQTVTLADLDRVMVATNDIMNPYAMGVNGRVIVNSIYRPAGATTTPSINWQYLGGGTLVAASALGAVNATPALPTGFTIDERENVIAAEVYYRFSPLLTSQWFGTTTIYRSAFYKPRLGALLNAPT